MQLVHYHANVYHQFFRKVQEVDYFIVESIKNRDDHRNATPEARGELFDKMQFLFSAYLGAMVSCWEIAKLSIHLDNVLNGAPLRAGMVSEVKLGSVREVFEGYFSVESEETFEWFKFLKVARNASAHDGTCASYGGSEQGFFYPGAIKRFEVKDEGFVPREEIPPCSDTIESMVEMAVQLVPLFASKLRAFVMTEADKQAQARSYLSVVPILDHLSASEIDGLVSQIVGNMRDTIAFDLSGLVVKWRGLL